MPNKFKNVPFDHVAGGALTARQSGKPAHAVGMLLVWAGVEAVNHFRHAWKCPACGNLFS
ncbi:MAG: hypothetical protein Q27BB25_06430 [Blastomonas sp. CACIA14H2]|nr:MAG: hypothetical protein Q27BB25_06430 [Blastomonas sp. CACIA14H2]